jgi:SUMO ligase MMS21 Smc5/6 complex component
MVPQPLDQPLKPQSRNQTRSQMNLDLRYNIYTVCNVHVHRVLYGTKVTDCWEKCTVWIIASLDPTSN